MKRCPLNFSFERMDHYEIKEHNLKTVLSYIKVQILIMVFMTVCLNQWYDSVRRRSRTDVHGVATYHFTSLSGYIKFTRGSSQHVGGFSYLVSLTCLMSKKERLSN